jgi:hypothetical protein
MKKRSRTKLIHEGQYVAEVDVELLETEDEWSPYLSLQDAYKLDEVRTALRRGDIESAARQGKIYRLTPISTPPGHEYTTV